MQFLKRQIGDANERIIQKLIDTRYLKIGHGKHINEDNEH